MKQNNNVCVDNSRHLYLDILNIAACFAVLLLHHNGMVFSFEPTAAWKESLVIECLFYWAVPVFMMISGANLLNYRERYNTRIYFKKRFFRTVVPFLLWSILILIWKVKINILEIGEVTFTQVFNLVFGYKIESVYWFFGPLFACYLIIPVLSYLVKDKKILWYIVGLNFIFISLFPAFSVWFGVAWKIDVPITGGLVIYVILGYLLHTTPIIKKWRIGLYSLGIMGVSFRFIYTYQKSMENHSLDTSIKGYEMFHAVFLAIAVFVIIQAVPWETIVTRTWIKNKIQKVSSYSFGIYLIHQIVMYYERKIFLLDVTSRVWRWGGVFVTYFISLLIVSLLKRLPKIGKVIC